MRVYFINSQDKHRTIGECNSFEEGESIIQEFLVEHNYKSYYTQVTLISETHRYYDVGSHTEFFEIKEE